MNVTEAVATRRTVRAFLDKLVDPAVLRCVLEAAQNAPSGGNTQPWNAVVLTGDPLADLLAKVAEVLPQGKAAFAPEYAVYPPGLEGRYEASRREVGEAMYVALAIPREDKPARLAWFARNFQAFGAPVMMLVHMPKYMGPPQWSDVGMWLQTVMLLLRNEGLDSCPQEAWAVYSRQIRACVNIPEDHIFFCGLGIGWRDPDAAVNQFVVPRIEIDEAVRWEGF
jgi:nitroreductase